MNKGYQRIHWPAPEPLFMTIVVGVGPITLLVTMLVVGENPSGAIWPYFLMFGLFIPPSVFFFWVAVSTRLVVSDKGFSKHTMLSGVTVPWSSICAVDLKENGAVELKVSTPYEEFFLLRGTRDGKRNPRIITLTDYAWSWGSNGFGGDLQRFVPEIYVPEQLTNSRRESVWNSRLTEGMSLIAGFFLGMPIMLALMKFAPTSLPVHMAANAWFSAQMISGFDMLASIGNKQIAQGQTSSRWRVVSRVLGPIFAAGIGVVTG